MPGLLDPIPETRESILEDNDYLYDNLKTINEACRLCGQKSMVVSTDYLWKLQCHLKKMKELVK